MRKLSTILVFLATIFSCQSQVGKVDNTQPMYGEVEKSKKFKEADAEFIKSCLEQFGSIDSSVYFHIEDAWRYYYHNDLNTAMKRFNHAWLLNPEYPDSYFGFASLMEHQGKVVEAKRLYVWGLEKDTENRRAVKCYQRIADCTEQINDIKGAIGAYIALGNLDSNNSFAFKKIAYLQMQSGQPTEAIKAYNKAIKLDPKDAMTYNNRAYSNQTLKNYQEAINDYSRAIDLNPKFIGALVNRGITQMEMKLFEKAKYDFEQCVDFDPKSGELRRFLALAQFGLKDSVNGCDNLKIAFELGDSESGDLIKEKCTK